MRKDTVEREEGSLPSHAEPNFPGLVSCDKIRSHCLPLSGWERHQA